MDFQLIYKLVPTAVVRGFVAYMNFFESSGDDFPYTFKITSISLRKSEVPGAKYEGNNFVNFPQSRHMVFPSL